MRTAALVLFAILAACGKKPPAQGPAGASGPDGAAAAPAAAPAASAEAFVAAVTALRRAPSDASRVPGPSGKDVSNFLATLHRGEAVTLLEVQEDWVKARSSGDTEGWLKRSAVLDGPGITLGTVVTEQDLFDRPELLAGNNRKIAPGTLLFVLKTKAPFSEVNVAGAQTAWVLADRVSAAEADVSVAKLAEKARWLVKNGKRDEALKVLAMARQHFAGAPLTAALAAELGEAPPAEGAVVPATGELPAGSPAPAPPPPG